MAKSDIKVVGGLSGGVFSWSTDDRTTSTHAAAIKPGEPLEAGLTGNNFALLLLTGEPVQASSTRFIGIAHSESTETASAEGEVEIEHIVPMCTVLEANATPYTIDENEGDDPNDHGLVMVGWSSERPTVIQFVVKPMVTLFGNNL